MLILRFEPSFFERPFMDFGVDCKENHLEKKESHLQGEFYIRVIEVHKIKPYVR